MINVIDKRSYRKRCGRCISLDTDECLKCNTRYNKYKK